MNSAKNRAGLNSSGYTIIEVLIVLVISGVMFLIAANFINGKVSQASFTQGVNEMASIIQSTLDQVINGQYSDIDLNCTYDPGTSTVTVNSGTNLQGTNNECVFLGKLIEGHPNMDTQYSILTLAGGRIDRNGNQIQYLTDLNDGSNSYANPTVITPLNVTQNVPQGLLINVMIGTGSGYDQESNTFGFIQSLGSIDAASGTLSSGAQSVGLYQVVASQPYGITFLPDGSSGPYRFDYSGIAGPALLAATQIDICVGDGFTNGGNFADIIVGDKDGTIAVHVVMQGTQPKSPCLQNWFFVF